MNDEICVKSQWIRGLTFPFSILLIFVVLVFRTDTYFRILFTSTEIEAPTPVCGNNGL